LVVHAHHRISQMAHIVQPVLLICIIHAIPCSNCYTRSSSRCSRSLSMAYRS
jgi:hypothetical protein